MSHEEEAVMIHCVDKRYSKNGVRPQLPEAYDLTAVGGTKRFVERETCRAEFFDQVRELQSVGKNITKVILVDHYAGHGSGGCAAYGSDDSRERHEHNLRRAAELIAAEPGFENFEIRLLMHDINWGDVSEVSVEKPAELVMVG